MVGLFLVLVLPPRLESLSELRHGGLIVVDDRLAAVLRHPLLYYARGSLVGAWGQFLLLCIDRRLGGVGSAQSYFLGHLERVCLVFAAVWKRVILDVRLGLF